MVRNMVELSDMNWIKRAAARFEDKVIRVPLLDCWLWGGPLLLNGYGKFSIGTTQILAHRYSYALHTGCPDGLEVDHLCRVRDCVNPAHLETVTRAENVARQSVHGHGPLNRTQCPSGHLYEGSNLYINPSGFKTCRRCRYKATTKYRASLKLQPAHGN